MTIIFDLPSGKHMFWSLETAHVDQFFGARQQAVLLDAG
jgi:hypothetical protein